MSISVVIPTYKNKLLFLENLKNNLKYLADCEIIIVNDDPADSPQEDLRQFANVRLFENSSRLGFGASVNIGVDKAKGDYVLLLNNDVILENDHFKEVIKLFEKDSALFAVSFAQREKDHSITGKNEIYWQNGFIRHRQAAQFTDGDTAWAEGGSSLIVKALFQKLGGFDSLYTPFYWEDIDLSYRAWKAGYKIWFVSQPIGLHHHATTIAKYFTTGEIKTISFRNQFIFIWKNITDYRLLLEHLRTLPKALFQTIIKGQWEFLWGFLAALTRLPLILFRRRTCEQFKQISDHEILARFKK